jgi:hypothetical protein
VILESVAARDGITVDQIVDRVFGDDPSGGPLGARRSIYVGINHLNTKLRLLGLRVVGENVGGPTDELGMYRLVVT